MLRVVLLSALVAASAVVQVPSKHLKVPHLDGKIVGGQPTNIESYPYQLSLQNYGEYKCGASIIRENVALTAGHCISSRFFGGYTVRAASTYYDQGGQLIKISKVNKHFNYNGITFDYDIAILHLAENIILGSSAKIVKLAALHQNVPAGTYAVVTGWGKLTEDWAAPSVLQVVNVPIVSAGSCKEALRRYGTITDRMICAGYTTGGKDACYGDSGGPLVVGDVQIGIVSWGYGCARPNYPGVYTSVPNLRNYIGNVTSIKS